MKKMASVVIRTFNEAEYIGRLIRNLRLQLKYGPALEIIVVDSGSTDSTMDILKEHNVKTISIAREKFNYSDALNLGIEHSSGRLIIILSAHAIPCKNNWLVKMIRNFEDQSVAGVYCRQVPFPQADLSEVLRIERTFGCESKTFSGKEFSEDMNFSNAASCIRASVWRKHPFVAMPAAEDQEWAKWSLENGYKIIYDAGAKVYHSHSESSRKAAQRRIDLEKSADIRNRRKRNLLLTTKQAMGWFIRDFRQIFTSNDDKDKRIKHAVECLIKSFWYILDFNQKK